MAAGNSVTQAQWAKLREGVASAVAPGAMWVIDGQRYTQPQLLARIDAMLLLFEKSELAKSSANAAVLAFNEALPANREWVVALTAVARQTLGVRSPQLIAFGLKPKGQRAPQTAQQKALAAVKRNATRKARHVMGKRQRAAIPSVQNLALQITAPVPTAPAPAPGAAGALGLPKLGAPKDRGPPSG